MDADASDLRQHLSRALGSAYDLERELGGGGMARVFVARDTRLGRRVVVKVLHPDMAAGVSATRFEREITLAAGLQHPHIISLHAAGEVTGLPYYTMPFVEGESLRARITREGVLPIASSVRLIRELADALDYAHRRGIVHRDLKPENVLLSEGHAVVADFGIAKALAAATRERDGGAGAGTSATATGMVLGTPAYMAPEQAAGDPATDHRADLYSLGVIAYELLTGAHPFAGRSLHALVVAHLTETPEPLAARRSDVPPALSALVMRLLAKRPLDRPASAAEVMAEIDSVNAPPPTGSQVAARRRRTVALLAGIAVLLVAGVAAVVMRRNGAPATSAQSADTTKALAPKSVAVLPLINAGGDTADAYFAAGMTDELTSALARVPGLRVASRSAASLIDTRQAVDVRDAGRRLNVRTVLAGRVRRQGTQLRLNMELVDVGSGAQLWSETYERDNRDAFRVQNEIARAIASALRVQLAGGTAPAQRGTESAEAHDLVLRARYQANLYTAASLARAVALYHQALTIDSTYADAWSGLAEAWGRTADEFVPASEAIPHLRAAVARALALDSTLADAHAQYGGLLGYYDRKYAAADREYVRALTLDSTLTSAAADYSNILNASGRRDSAAAVLLRAQRIDPLSPYLAYWAPINFVYLNRPADARAACSVAAEVSAVLGHRCDTHLLFAEGHYAALIDTLAGESMPTPWTHAFRAAALSRLRRQPEAKREAELVELAARRHYLDERIPAGMYAAMGDADRAIAWLERGFTSNAAIIAYMNIDNRLAPLRPDPRFQALLRRAGLR